MNRRQLADENYRLGRANNELADKVRKLQLENDEIMLRTNREIDAISTRNRASDVRLEVLRSSGYASIEDLNERASWVLTAAVPAKTEQDEKLVDFPVKGEIAELPRISRDDIVSVLRDLEVVDEKLMSVYTDPNLSVGKVRIQKAAGKLGYVLEDLRRIVRDAS